MKISKRYHRAFYDFVSLGGYPSLDYFREQGDVRKIKGKDFLLLKFCKFERN